MDNSVFSVDKCVLLWIIRRQTAFPTGILRSVSNSSHFSTALHNRGVEKHSSMGTHLWGYLPLNPPYLPHKPSLCSLIPTFHCTTTTTINIQYLFDCEWIKRDTASVHLLNQAQSPAQSFPCSRGVPAYEVFQSAWASIFGPPAAALLPVARLPPAVLRMTEAGVVL